MKKDMIRFHFGKSFYIGLLTVVCSLTIVAIAMATFSPKKSAKDPLFIRYDSYYDGSQVQIQTEGNASEITTITMTAAAQENSNNGKIITIESDEELRLFSSKCSSNNSFLGYTYYLISNIEWDSQYTFTPIGTSSNPFIGTFNGQGYEIEGLSLTLNNANYNGGSYYSMFNYVGAAGTITNLGLSHPELKILDAPTSFEAGGVSYLVGENNGNVSNSFVVDDKDATKELAGISVSISNSRVSDLVVINNGTLSNCYVVTSRVFNIKQNDLVNQYNQIAISNTGTITNCYFYDDSIRTLTPTDNNKATVTYKVSSKMVDKVNDYFGTYVSSIDNLVTAIDSNWYTKNDYGSYKDYTGIKYGLRRGITLSGSTFTINNEKDFAYMYELFNADDKFASNEITYNITANLNLEKIPVSSYTYKKGIGATIIGSTISGTPTMANGSNSAYPTIYNADVMNSSRIAKSTGVDCYGLFNYLTGTVENLNIVPTSMDFSAIETSTNAKGIGVLSGYIEGGHVKNVNVYANITNTTAKDIGEYYIGGITGILGGNGKINGATSAGSINLPNATTTLQASSSYMGGVAIGGIVGYIESSNGAVYTCLNAMNITAKLGSSITYTIGGVIGAGYTMNYDKIVSNGITTVMRTERLENLGTISVCDSTSHAYSELYVAGIIGRHLGELDEVSSFTNRGNITVYANGNTTYVSGVENADIISTAINNTKVEASQFKDGAGNTLFYASSFANAANVTVEGSSTNLNYTNVSNIKAGNHVKSRISDFYNLAYGYRYEGDDYKAIYKLSTQQISMNLHTTFAPVLNVIGGTSQYTTEATTLYNLRNITFSLSTAISTATTFNYTGCALGEYISYGDIKNEGKMDISLAAGISTTSILKVSGLFETLSNGCTARNLYNGGDITINEPNGSAAEKKIDMYLSGICYQNLSVDSSEKQNPLNANFDSNLVGTMDSIINNGKITVSSYYLAKTTAINTNPSTKPYYNSNIYVGGISYLNSGIISNAFNLGSIDVSAYSTAAKNYEAGGISCRMDGDYAQIRDSANNGNIYVIDLGGKVTSLNSIVNVGGIVSKNNLHTGNSKEVIAFTINYGTIIGFIARDNMSTTSFDNAHGIASGVIGTGICNMVNIVNYGNIYGKECVAGVIGRVKLGYYSESYKITVANTLNYGQVKIIPPYDNSQKWATYNVILGLSTVRSNEYNLMYTHAGSICSIFDFNQRNNITIRYLINLYNGELTVFSSLNVPEIAPKVDTFITTKSATDSFGGESNKIPYAPLSSLDENGNIGVFSSEFIFRKAINGIGLDNNYVTDSYISNFFQFVKFDKVNQELLEKIGWRTIAYANAAEDLVKNVGALKVLVENAGTTATNLLSDAFESDTWISTCNMDIIDSLIASSINSGSLDSAISTILNYVLFDTTATSSYTLAIRTELINKILEFYEKQGNNDYYIILQSMLYDTLLAKIVSEDNSNYALVKAKIEDVLSESNNLETILNNYITLLQTNGAILNELFTGSTSSYYETPKINLVSTLLAGYDDSTLEALYNELNLTVEDEDDSLKYKLYLQTHESEAANIYAHLIINNSLASNSNYLNWINNSIDKYNIGSMIDSSSLPGVGDDFGNITTLTGYRYSPVNSNDDYNSEASQLKTIRQFETADITSLNIEPTKDYRNLWNIIKNDAGIQEYISNHYFITVKNPTTDLDESGIIAKATEYTNTYQTNDRTMSDYGMEYGYDHEVNGDSFYAKQGTNGKYYCGINYGYNNTDKNFNFFGGNSFNKNYPIRTRFIYTPDDYVTYRTNYLGPYATKTGIVYDEKVNNNNGGTFFSGNQYGYKKGANLAATDESTQTARGTVPVLICINEGLANKLIAASGTNASDKSLYLYHWSDNNAGNGGPDVSSAYMWKQENFVTLAPSNTTGYIYNNYSNDTYMCDYYNFDPEFVPTQQKDYNQQVNIPGAGSISLINNTGAAHTYKEHYLTAYCSAAVITGLYYTYSSWPNGNVKCVSLLAKRDGAYAWNKVSGLNRYAGVHTTDYICYKIEDLVKLDGYKTKGFNSSNPTNDQDETNIIGSIVTKLLADNKALVLKAIYNYSIDNNFVSEDANSLNLLLKNITDTSFASSSVAEGLAGILNMNYSGINTISSHLDSLNIVINGYRDKLIVSTVNNQNNFKNLLIQTLTNYSKKSSDYSTYNLYNRDDINNFIYKYLAYLYEEDSAITATQIDSFLSNVSDTDLQKLEDLLIHIKNTFNSYDDEEYEYNDVFTFYDVVVFSSQHPNYSENVIVAGDYSDISFRTGDYQYGYKLEVTYKGTIDLDGSDSHNSVTKTTYTFNNLSYNSSYSLNLAQGTEIYDIKLYKKAYSGLSDTPESVTNATSMFTTIDGVQEISNANFVSNGDVPKHTYLYGNYYSNLWRNKNKDTDSDIYLKMLKGTNVLYNTITISFKALSYYTYDENNFHFYALYNNDGTKATSSSYDNYLEIARTFDYQLDSSNKNLYQYSYSYSVPSSLITLLDTQDVYITINLEKDCPQVGNDYLAFSINDLIISYDFDFANNTSDNTNKTKVVFNQNVFNPYYNDTIRSNYTITNSNNNCGVDISGGSSTSQSLTFANDSPTTVYSTSTKQINAALLFEPWYYPLINLPEALFSQIDLSQYDFGGDSIKENFENGKYDVSNVAKYITKEYFQNLSNDVYFNLSNESFVEIYATGEGNISILDIDDNERIVAVSTALNEYKYYEFIVPSGTYKLICDTGVSFEVALAVPTNIGFDYSTSENIDIFKVVSGDDEVDLLSLDYSSISDPLGTGSSDSTNNNINVVGNSQLSEFRNTFGNSYDNYSMFYEVYPYKREHNTTKTTQQLRLDDVFASVITLMATIHQDSNNSDYYSIFMDSTFYDDDEEDELVEIIKLIAIADNIGNNSAFKKLVNGLSSTLYKSLLLEFNISEVKVNIAKKLYAISATDSNVAKYIYAAYLGNDYLNHNNLYTESLMYSLLNVFNDGVHGAGYYQFITSNTTVDADKVTALISYLSNNSNINIDGYGIFALSSSQGIGYGIFIPDNLDLSTMDNQYYYDNVNDVLMLGNNEVSYWRGGENINLGAEGSVDYAFYHDMKQLIKSISTDIFELNISNGGTTIKSVDDQIDNDNKVITYYLTTGLGSIYNASSISITNDYKLANGATLSSQTISLTGSNVTKTQGVSVIVKDGVTVYAEDTGVSSKYTLKFIAIDPSGLTLTSDVNSIAYNGGTVTLTLTGNDLPNGLDIEPYIVLTVDGEEYNTADGYWKLDPAFTNNAVVNNGSATIKIIINKSLPGGTDAVNIKIDLANMPSVVLTKVQNTEKNITSFGFVPFGQANQEYNSNVPTSITSTIPYGRAYDYSELTDPTSNNFYLYKFNVSDNANVQITATKTILESGLMRYVVRYSVTAEAGGTAKVYTHTLNEAQYFAENTQYVSIYADGDEVTRINSEAYNALTANEKPRYLFEGTLNYNIAEDVCIRATFDSHETYYQIKYSVASVDSTTFTTNGNLYVLSNGVYNKVTSGSFSSTVTYYQRDYVVKAVTSASFTTDGSLYKLVDGVYTQIFNGSYDSAVTYYELQYVTASVNSTTFTSNGSLYTRSGSGTISSPYVYSQVIDKRSNTDDMFASVAFNRTDTSGNSIEPQYRVKYSLANFYTIGDNVEFGTTTSTLGNLATTNITYAGLTVTVSENNDTGTYKFIFTYKNTGVWDNNEVYVRYYEFPEFIVEKQASTDALLHKLTFLEESIVLGNTATVILPTKPLVPDKSGQYYDNTEEIYKTQFESTTRQIVVSASGIKYNDADATSITDYYAIGTVSDADLSYYSPGFEINEYAQIYQYTTLKKLTEYGVGKQTDSDKNILSVHDNMYFYVPYTISNETIVYLVEIDANGYWGNVYTTDFAGNRYSSVTSGSYSEGVTYYSRSGNDYVVTNVTAQTFTTNGSLYVDTLVHTYDASYVNAKNAQVTGGFGDYTVSEFAGSPDKNSSLYMDYTGTPLDGHFWYVSYVVLSEDYLCGGNSRGNVRYYHISIIDATNNVQFEVVFYADTTMNMDDIYLTISETTYKKVNDQKIENGNRQISAYAEETDETYSGSRTDISGFKIYKLKYRLQILPSGYFYFYVDLPDGYVAEARTDKTNNISSVDEARYPGAFDPQTSIITVKIQLEIVIKKGTNENSNVWAFNTADKYTRQADYVGTII